MAKPTLALRAATNSPNAAYCPDADDIIWIDFNPQVGNEQRGRRPALVLSPRIYNQKLGLCVLCPITNQAKGYPFEVKVEGGQTTGVALADHVKSLSWAQRNSTFVERADPNIGADVRAKIRALLLMP